MMSGRWQDYTVSVDSTHHVHRRRPAYAARFHEVLTFHEPGLAPAIDDSGAFHITPDGLPAYDSRHMRTFGFYDGRAAAQSDDGWLHILPDGAPLYTGRFAWCGNFQEDRCPARQDDGLYFHIALDGSPLYKERYAYAGDFRDGIAVAQRGDGTHTHIDASGVPVHGRWFMDLDVFHKGFARACDPGGWHHVDMRGESLYARRFKYVEPFYNGQARVKEFSGALSVIDESGETLLQLRKQLQSDLESLSGEMVGLWRTQAIRAAVELGVIEALPAPVEEMESDLLPGLAPGMVGRLARALMELGLLSVDSGGVCRPTDRGLYLTRNHPLSLADAASHWGRESYAAWSGIVEALRTGEPAFPTKYGGSFFDWVSEDPGRLESYQRAMATYARHDYGSLSEAVDFSTHQTVLDAGGGTGELVFALLRSCPHMIGTVLDMPGVVESATVPSDLDGRCHFVGGDLFHEWPARAEAVILARALHDWPDGDALRILERAREAMDRDGLLYVVEMLLGENTGAGGLLDLHMLVMTGGRERTQAQFRELLAGALFEMIDVTPTQSVSSVIRARAV